MVAGKADERTVECNSDRECEFELIYHQYYGFIMTVAHNMAHGNVQLIDEIPMILQDVFLQLYQRYHLLASHPHLDGWLVVTTYYTMRRARRKLNKWNNRYVSLDDDNIKIQVERQNVDDYFYNSSNDIFDRVADCLDMATLTLLQRYYEKNADHEQLAEEYGMTSSALRKRVSRQMAKLREILHLLILFLLIWC